MTELQLVKFKKVDPAQYGIPEKKAQEISKMFKPMLDKMVELEKEFNKIVDFGKITPEICLLARELRLKYVKIRTATDKIHKELKQYFLQGGRFVDGWKNAQILASQSHEERLTEIERHFEIMEQQKKEELNEKRKEILQKAGVDFIPDNLGEMSEDIWSNYLLGAKESVRIRKEAELEAEKKRKEKELQDKKRSERDEILRPYYDFLPDTLEDLGIMEDKDFKKLIQDLQVKKQKHEAEQERIRKENELLKKKQEEEEQKKKLEEEKQNKKMIHYREELEKHGYEYNHQTGEFKKSDTIVTFEGLENLKETQLHSLILQNDRIIKDREELQKKRNDELQRQKEEAERIEAESKKGDEERVQDLIKHLKSIQTYKFKSKKYKDLFAIIYDLVQDGIDLLEEKEESTDNQSNKFV